MQPPEQYAYQVQSVSFSGEWVEFTFLEPNKQTEKIKAATTMVVAAEQFPVQVSEIKEALDDLVHRAQVALRNPPDSIPR